jgi:hypothetical protein
MDKETLELIRLLLTRLERTSADSYWAHRASGARGALLRMAEILESGGQVPSLELKRALQLSFHILEQAANEKF